MSARRRWLAGVLAVPWAGLLVVACGGSSHSIHFTHTFPKSSYRIAAGIHKIKHVVVIMQENRSFDSYFGTYPGADGIPGVAGNPGSEPCVANAQSLGALKGHKKKRKHLRVPSGPSCIKPFHDRFDENHGGPHSVGNARADINGGAMNGFVASVHKSLKNCTNSLNPACGGQSTTGSTDVMGYHTGADIPNYWAYARNYVLQDHMFESVSSWSLPAHLYMVSMWSAHCTSAGDPWSCSNEPAHPGNPPGFGHGKNKSTSAPHYAWTDLTYLLDKHHVSWRYYVFSGSQPDCDNASAMSCSAIPQNAKTASIWNPLPYFDDVHQDHQLGDVQSLGRFFTAAHAGTLPAVSWITPTKAVSEHPTGLVSAGQSYVTSLIDAIMRGPDWKSTAIFLAWDDWGGFYDHINPPGIDQNGYGLRVPSLVISPYAKQGFIDHQTLSFDAYAKFIEDDFLGGRRLDPRNDGRPDPRPDVREDAPQLGNPINDFNFNQAPRSPVILPLHPKTDLIAPGSGLP
jgi:phospholipase C